MFYYFPMMFACPWEVQKNGGVSIKLMRTLMAPLSMSVFAGLNVLHPFRLLKTQGGSVHFFNAIEECLDLQANYNLGRMTSNRTYVKFNFKE
jgi:hypothetical protein